MQIQINTDHNIEGRESLATWAADEVKRGLNHHAEHITRVEVHLGDEIGRKGSVSDKRCVMEARLQGRPPMAVTHHAESLNQAVTGAAEKLNRMIDSALGRAARSETATPELLPTED